MVRSMNDGPEHGGVVFREDHGDDGGGDCEGYWTVSDGLLSSNSSSPSIVT
jgi:hypothetical protein